MSDEPCRGKHTSLVRLGGLGWWFGGHIDLKTWMVLGCMPHHRARRAATSIHLRSKMGKRSPFPQFLKVSNTSNRSEVVDDHLRTGRSLIQIEPARRAVSNGTERVFCIMCSHRMTCILRLCYRTFVRCARTFERRDIYIYIIVLFAAAAIYECLQSECKRYKGAHGAHGAQMCKTG